MSFTIGGGVNLEKCYTDLFSADLNKDGYLSQSEYLIYLQNSAPNGILNTNSYGIPISTFSMLPQSFIGVYNFFACGDAYVGCPSVIGIDIRGLLGLLQSNSGDGTTVELSGQEMTFLYQLCKDTEEVVNEFEDSLVNTTTTTAKPTNEPTSSSSSSSTSTSVVPTAAPPITS